MNIWHDISDKRIKKDDFMCYIEIQKGSRSKYELDKETGVLKLDRVYTHPRFILRVTVLFRGHWQRTEIRWMFWFYAVNRYCLPRWCNVTRSELST